MSIKIEQYHSLKITKEFLRDLLDFQERPKSVKEMKQRASQCLRHFPVLDDDGKPYFSKE
jgi:hypothetical protein